MDHLTRYSFGECRPGQASPALSLFEHPQGKFIKFEDYKNEMHQLKNGIASIVNELEEGLNYEGRSVGDIILSLRNLSRVKMVP